MSGEPHSELGPRANEQLDAMRTELDRLQGDNEELRAQRNEALDALEAIRTGQVDSLVIDGPEGPRVFSLEGATHSYRILLEEMNEGAATLSDDGTILWCNPCLAQLLGNPLERTMGSSMHAYIPARFGAEFATLLNDAVRADVRQEMSILAGPAGEVPVYFSVSTMVDAGRRLFCLVATDLRNQRAQLELQEANRSLEQADQRKNEFLALLAHELRNPLAAISNAHQVLDRSALDETRAARMRSVIGRQVKHFSRLIDDLLDVGRITQGKLVLKREPVLLSSCIEQAIALVRPSVEAENHHLSVSLPAEPLWLDADPARLEQLIGNLLSNAVKYTNRGGHIAISARREGSQAVLAVRDTGVGISADLLPHVFEPFRQADSSLSRAKGGLGIGLALVHSLTALHGGSVEASSAGPGKGAEFVVRLPCSEVCARPAEHNAGEPESSPGGHLRILAVDDNRDAADSLADLMRLWGHKVRCAYDGPSAIEAALTFRADLILLDIGLPGLDGYEVARRLRAIPELQGTTIVALTGYGHSEALSRAQQVGFDAHATKPVEIGRLQQILASAKKK